MIKSLTRSTITNTVNYRNALVGNASYIPGIQIEYLVIAGGGGGGGGGTGAGASGGSGIVIIRYPI